MQPVLPELTSDLKLTIELVGHARACRVALVEPVIPHIVVDAKAEFEASDQPLSERVVDLESNVAIEDTGYAGDGRFSDCCPPIILTVVSALAVYMSEASPIRPLISSSRGSS